MKSKKKVHLSLFFSLCIVASLFASVFQNLNTPFSNTGSFYSKHYSLTEKEQKSANTDFLFEENEIETESSLDIKLWASALPFLLAFSFHFKALQSGLYLPNALTEQKTNPIYISVCSFRI